MIKTTFSLAVSAVFLIACSQPEPMMEVTAEPIYNKMGDVVGCTDGRTIDPSTAPANPCEPDDGCDEQLASTFDPNCPPPHEDGKDDSDNGGSTQPDPQ